MGRSWYPVCQVVLGSSGDAHFLVVVVAFAVTWLHAGLCPSWLGREGGHASSIRLDLPQPMSCTSGYVTTLPNPGLRPAGRQTGLLPLPSPRAPPPPRGPSRQRAGPAVSLGLAVDSASAGDPSPRDTGGRFFSGPLLTSLTGVLHGHFLSTDQVVGGVLGRL